MFPFRTGHPATPLRMALGILIIQKRKKLSDRAVIKEIQENPYLQYFIGMEGFRHEQPVTPTVLVSFGKCLSADFLMEAADGKNRRLDRVLEEKPVNDGVLGGLHPHKTNRKLQWCGVR